MHVCVWVRGPSITELCSVRDAAHDDHLPTHSLTLLTHLLYLTAQLLERVRACGITAHRLNGKYVLKGSRRAAASGATSMPVAKVGSAP